MRRLVLCLGSGMIAALLCFAPAEAEEGEAETRTRADGSQSYVDPSLADESTTRIEGVLRRVVADSKKGGDESTVILTDDNVVVPVDFDAKITATDASVTAQLVDGDSLDAALEGDATAPVEVASARVESSSVASAAGINHRAYVAIIANSGAEDATSAIEARVDAGLAYWREEGGASVPALSRSGATVVYNSALSVEARCGMSSPYVLWTEAAKRFPGVSFSDDGNHLVVVVADDCDDYGIGVGTVGSSINSGGLVTMIEDSTIFTSTLAHELGHNFGLEHANFCAPSCTAPATYWNLYSPMGLAVASSQVFGPPALDSAQRDQLGITVPGETETFSGGVATIDISPRGSATGLRGVEVRSGSTSYWVEYRHGGGRDASTFYAAANGSQISGRSYPDGVTITRQLSDSQTPTALMARTASVGSWSTGAPFAVGGITITVNSLGSTASVSIGAVPPLSSSTPTLSQVPRVAQYVSAVTNGWEPGTTFSYQWRLGNVAIAGATGETFRSSIPEYGKKLSVSVTGTKTGFHPVTRTSAQSTVAKGSLIPVVPTISGTAKVGKTLRVVPGTWTYSPKLTYRWYVNGNAISRATKSYYKITSGKRGKYITVKVSASKTGFSSTSRTSARTAKVR